MARQTTLPGFAILMTTLIRVINFFVALGGLLIITLVIVLQRKINIAPGWCLVALGVITIFSSITGILSHQIACFVVHLVFNSLAVIGTFVSSMAIFADPDRVARAFHSRYEKVRYVAAPSSSPSPAPAPMIEVIDRDKLVHFLKGAAWGFLVLFFLQVLSTTMAVIARRCIPLEAYEDLNADTRQERTTAAMLKIRRDADKQADKTTERKNDALTKKMKEKYGKWSHESWGNASRA